MAYNPVRAGTRGGQGDFKWSDVKDDKDRENYLGHSILAPKGRWQNNRDITWYNKDNPTAEAERAAEIRAIKEAEEDALSVALGFAPVIRAPPGPHASTSSTTARDPNEAILEKAQRKREKEERKHDRAERRDAKERIKSERSGGSRREERGEMKREEVGEREREGTRDERGREGGEGRSRRREEERDDHDRRRGSGRDRSASPARRR